MRTAVDLLRRALTDDPARPAVTWYDDATGERVELSVATLDNWVAKTANLLVDGLGAHPGGSVGLRLPCHWLAPVWLLAAWSAGQVVVLGAAAGETDVLVVGPDDLAWAEAGPAGEVVGLSLLPLGRPFAEPLRGRATDYAAEVLGHGDRFMAPFPAGPDDQALTDDAGTWTAGRLVVQAETRSAELGLDAGRRVLSTAAPTDVTSVVDTVLVPLAGTTGVVLCRHLDPTALPRRVEQERVGAVGVDGPLRATG